MSLPTAVCRQFDGSFAAVADVFITVHVATVTGRNLGLRRKDFPYILSWTFGHSCFTCIKGQCKKSRACTWNFVLKFLHHISISSLARVTMLYVATILYCHVYYDKLQLLLNFRFFYSIKNFSFERLVFEMIMFKSFSLIYIFVIYINQIITNLLNTDISLLISKRECYRSKSVVLKSIKIFN